MDFALMLASHGKAILDDLLLSVPRGVRCAWPVSGKRRHPGLGSAINEVARDRWIRFSSLGDS
jgi:hypothetical protein